MCGKNYKASDTNALQGINISPSVSLGSVLYINMTNCQYYMTHCQ